MRKRYYLLIILFLPVLVQSQTLEDTSSVLFFVNIDEFTPLDTVIQYLDDLNCTEVWKTSDNTLALWEVSGYPFVTPEGEQITNINSVIRASKKKTKIQDATFNTLSTIPGGTVPQASTFDIADYTLAQGTERSVRISILDTGIDPNISNSSTSSLNYNLTSYTGYDYVNNDGIPEDENGHGSHIAGIIHSITHGTTTNGTKIDFDIRKTHNSNGQGYISNVVIALYEAVRDANADIVNLSFGMTDTFASDVFFPMRIVIQEAANRDALVVAAAGNDGRNIDILTETTLPAGFPEENILSVVALDSLDQLASFSNFGVSNTDLGVLGEHIPGPNLSGGISYRSGTSQATAIISGIAALVATYQSSVDPYALKCSIMKGVVNVPALVGLTLSEGKIDSENAKNNHTILTPSYLVTTNAVSGTGSLARGLNETCGVEQIVFDPSLSGQVIPLDLSDVKISGDLTITGNGEVNTIIDLLNSSHIQVMITGELTLSELTIRKNGNDPSIINKGVLILASKVKLE